MALYHYTICLPKGYQTPQGIYNLEWTHHALQALITDKYAFNIIKADTINCKDFITIEVETDVNGRFIKVLLQGEYNEHYNISYALMEALLSQLIPPIIASWLAKTRVGSLEVGDRVIGTLVNNSFANFCLSV